MTRYWLGALALLMCGTVAADAKPWVVYVGFDGPGKGKHIVFITGDEEYRSEEGLPMLGKILAKHHGTTFPGSPRSTRPTWRCSSCDFAICPTTR